MARPQTSVVLLCASLAMLCSCNCGKPVTEDPDGGTPGDGGTLDDGGVSNCISGATELAIAPAGTTVTLTNPPAPISFTASATIGGTATDVTTRVNWDVSRADGAPAGTISAAGVYTPTLAAGVVTVTVSDGCVSSSTTVTLKVDAVFQDPGPTITDRFNGPVVTTDAAKAPLIVYPNTETRFPRNIYKVLFQWRKQGNEYFRLTFQGPNSKTVVWSDGVHAQCAAATPPAGCYEATVASWAAIAASNAGEVVTLIVDGVAANDPNVYRSASINIGFSKKDVKGALFYWSTTSAGIRRASVSDLAPEAYAVGKPVATVLPNSGAIKCVACHTVSRSGKKMISATEAATASGMFVYDVTLQAPPTDFVTQGVGGPGHEFGTISPDDRRAVATKKGVLQEFDITGAGPMGPKVADLPLGMLKATQPDWSPNGNELAFAGLTGMGINDAPAGASIWVIAYNGNDSWGAVRTVAPANGMTNLFPSYMPQSDWLAYSRGAKGGHGDKTTQLFIIKADGTGGTAGVELVKANRWVNNQVTTGQFENNQPTWAPSGDLEWVAFNSLRPYGVVFPTGGTQQIWVAAVDRNQLDGGIDPSYPAFRFAFQDLNENNHRAFWTLDVRVPEDGGNPQPVDAGYVDAGTCLPLGMTCSQTGSPSCCGPLVCDVSPDGGQTFCMEIGVN